MSRRITISHQQVRCLLFSFVLRLNLARWDYLNSLERDKQYRPESSARIYGYPLSRIDNLHAQTRAQFRPPIVLANSSLALNHDCAILVLH